MYRERQYAGSAGTVHAYAQCLTPMANGVGGAAATGAERRWYTTCFRMPLDIGGEPVWALGLLLADRVAAHADDSALWRCQRRAAPDAAGHQFGLLVHASPPTTERQRCDADPTLRDLQVSGQVKDLIHGCGTDQGKPEIAATSDPGRDPAIQRAWPWFIMGVSTSGLTLIQDLAHELLPAGADPLPAYRAIDARIERLWSAEGQHGSPHHLSGLYGYRQIRIETWMQY